MNRLDSTCLGDLGAQQLQMELIRRLDLPEVNGALVADCLSDHSELWQAVLMDRLVISDPGCLPASGLAKLEDFLHSRWTPNTLFILTGCQRDAEALATIFAQREWGGIVRVHADPEEVDNSLGGAEPGQSIVSISWNESPSPISS